MGQTDAILINEQHPGDNEPKGIGGWLILVILGYIFSLIGFFGLIYDAYNLYIDGSIKMLSNKEGNNYNPEMVLLINYQMIVSIIFFLFTAIVVIYLYKKKRIYPKLAITLIVVGDIFVLLGILISCLLGVKDLNAQLVNDVIRLIPQTLWIFYFIKSRRVKNTFVN